MSGRPAVFLDRDGVLVEEVGYLASPERLALIDGAPGALRRLRDSGFQLVVVSNQSAIARGLLTEAGLESLHERLRALLGEHGAGVDAWLYCPHHPHEGQAAYRRSCDCRKPAPGMLLAARERLGLDLARSYLVGDRRSDVEAAHRAGCRAVLVRTGYGAGEAARAPASPLEAPEAVVDTLAAAAGWILQDAGAWRAVPARESA